MSATWTFYGKTSSGMCVGRDRNGAPVGGAGLTPAVRANNRHGPDSAPLMNPMSGETWGFVQ